MPQHGLQLHIFRVEGMHKLTQPELKYPEQMAGVIMQTCCIYCSRCLPMA